MAKTHAAAAAIAVLSLASTGGHTAQAFQAARPAALPLASAARSPSFPVAADVRTNDQQSGQQRRGATHLMAARNPASRPSNTSSLFRTTSLISQKTRRALQKLRRSCALLLASLAFFLASTRVHAPPAHAASTATATTLSLTQKLNPFRTRSADEMIDAYVKQRLFADDQFDPVESAYREAYADGSVSKDSTTSAGAYPTLLAETAATALGQQKGMTLVPSNSASAGTEGKNDGITAVLIKSSDFLQSKLKVSAGASYYILAGGGLVGICVLPGMLGVLYQGLQRWQIDKSEMKMYGKISDMDATSKKETDDDDDDDEE